MKSAFLERLLERMDRLDPESLQTHFLHLAQEAGLLEAIFQSMQEGLIVLSGDGRVTFANRSAERLLGFALDQVKGRPIQRYLKEIDWDRILALDAAEWTKLGRYEIEVLYPEHRILSFYVVPKVVVGSEEKGAVVILRDVTGDRQDKETMVESERLNAIRLLAAGVAHEIGNPLNALHIHLQILERELRQAPEAQRENYLELIGVAKREVSRLDLILTQFLRAIRPGKPQVSPAALDELVKETLGLVQPEIESRGIRVAIDCPEPLPVVRVDRDQMKQAFFNVIRNALQAMSDGGSLAIGMTVSDRTVRIAFRDTGSGIAAEDFSHVFEPYFTTKPGGTGLGLMIVQRIVQEHGGRIDLQSAPGSGTTLAILLPLDEPRVRLLKAPDDTAEEGRA